MKWNVKKMDVPRPRSTFSPSRWLPPRGVIAHGADSARKKTGTQNGLKNGRFARIRSKMFRSGLPLRGRSRLARDTTREWGAPDMNLNHLHAFYVVARERGFTR